MPERVRSLGGPQIFAGTTMLLLGACHALAGIAALAGGAVPGVPSLTFTLPPTAWGWIQIVSGALLALAGGDVLRGGLAGRLAGIGLASLSLVVNIMFLLLYPAWATVIMAIDVLVLRALTVAWPDPERAPDQAAGSGAGGLSRRAARR